MKFFLSFIFLLISHAWPEMYLVVARVVQLFDFDFKDMESADFEMASNDKFIIGIKSNAAIDGLVTLR